MIETIIVYLAGGALAIALFFVLVARIVRLITGKDLLNKKFPFIRDITNKMFLIGITFAVVYVIVMAFILLAQGLLYAPPYPHHITNLRCHGC